MAQALDLTPKKLPRQARARASVEAMLDACTRLLVDEGYEAVSTNRVAEVAGVSIGSLYEYFPHKQSLVAAALARAMRELLVEVGESMRTALALPNQPHDGIDHWMHAMVASLEKREDLLRVSLREVPFFWNIPETREFSRTLQQFAKEGQYKSQRVIHFADPEASTYLLMNMTWAAVLQTVLHRPAHLSRERLTRTLVDMVLKLL